jgi:hypothetical protein
VAGGARGAGSAAAPCGGWQISLDAMLSLQPKPQLASESTAVDEEKDTAAVGLLTARLLTAAGHAPTPSPQLLAAMLKRLRSNVHTLHDASAGHVAVGGGLYPLAALANHSCAPSASVHLRFGTLETAAPATATATTATPATATATATTATATAGTGAIPSAGATASTDKTTTPAAAAGAAMASSATGTALAVAPSGAAPSSALARSTAGARTAASSSRCSTVTTGGGGGGALCLELRATRALPKGAEVTVAYVELASPAAERAAALAHGYGFACDCERCHGLTGKGSHGGTALRSSAWPHEAGLAGVNCPRCGTAAALANENGTEGACANGCQLTADDASAVSRAAAAAQAELAFDEAAVGKAGAPGDAARAKLSAAVDAWASRLPATSAWLYQARRSLADAAIEGRRWSEAVQHLEASAEACAHAYGSVSVPVATHAYALAKLLALVGRGEEAGAKAQHALQTLRAAHAGGEPHPLCAQIEAHLAM